MNQSELETLVYHSLDHFYQSRAKKLIKLKLRDVFYKKHPYIIRAVGTQNASEIVGELLKYYMFSFNEGIFGETIWEELAEYPDFYSTLISLMSNQSVKSHIEYETELAHALNRFEHEFLINFGNPDGSIDWEKLLRFNSGKENIRWIARVVPEVTVEVEDEDEDKGENSEA